MISTTTYRGFPTTLVIVPIKNTSFVAYASRSTYLCTRMSRLKQQKWERPESNRGRNGSEDRVVSTTTLRATTTVILLVGCACEKFVKLLTTTPP